MSRLLRILLVEDDTDVCQRFKAEIEETDTMTLLDVTDNSSDALELTRDHFPDVVLLDLELTNGKGNGLEYLSKLKSIYLATRPYIIVTTNNASTITHEAARELGADFMFFKHQKGYSEKSVLEFLNMMQNTILRKQLESTPVDTSNETPAERNQRLKRCISAELNFVGINPKSVGYEYLVEAIFLAIEGQHTYVIPVVADSYHKAKAAVERGIQNAINRAWRSMDVSQLLVHYKASINPQRGVPTLTEFIYYYADKVKNEHL